MSRARRKASSRRSRQVEQGTLGTHVQRRQATSALRRNSVNFKSRSTARTGEISQVMPKTTSRESATAYAQRSRQRGFVLNDQKKGRLRAVLLVLLVAGLLLSIATGVTWLVFKAQVANKMHFSDASLAEVLSLPEDENDPYYVLLAGTFEDSQREDDGPHLLTLVRVDVPNKLLTLISLPSNIEMTMSDDEYHILSYAQILGGNAELVTQVENLCGLEIAHVVMLDSEGFINIVDGLGGITLNIEQEADDPDTGSIYIPAGQQTLNGEQALTLVRCDNYTTPLETRAQVQAQVIEAIVATMLGKSNWSMARAFDSIAGNVQTTYSFEDLWDLAHEFGRGQGFTLYSGMVPGQLSVDPDGIFYSVSRVSFDSMLETIDEGRNPDEAATVSGLTPGLVEVTVKNGAGIVGGAAQVAGMLEEQGYKVPETGNADNYVYDETLVVYKSDLYKPTAEDILTLMGNGRTIEAGLFYEFETDILVIVGKDWVPTY